MKITDIFDESGPTNIAPKSS